MSKGRRADEHWAERRAVEPRGSEFVFARLRYDSGDWDSNKDYGCEWDYDWRNTRCQREDITRFAVNIVVYAMSS